MADDVYEACVHAPSGEHRLFIGKSDRGRRLTDILAEYGLVLNTPCGQEGQCDGCCIKLAAGSVIDRVTGVRIIAGKKTVDILACQHTPGVETFMLRLPVRALAWAEPDVLDAFRIDRHVSFNPIWPGDMPVGETDAARPIGAAIDLGTTTVTLMLIDLVDGQVLSRASGLNKQVRFGQDVLTRINLCMRCSDGVMQLRDAVLRETIQPLLISAGEQAGIDLRQVVCATVAGNTTMLHLLAGEDPSPLGVVPFTPVFLMHRLMSSVETGLADIINQKAVFHLLPGAAAYVGADLTAGVIASGMLNNPGTSMLVDIGTNGEVVLHHDGKLLGCATAAGPAFEGAGLSCGCRAGRGAINHIHLSGDSLMVGIDVIHDAEPVGLCGSAYIDLLAEGVASGLLTTTGRFARMLPGGVNGCVTVDADHGRCFMVADGVWVSEADIARLLQAKAAIAAGIQTVLERVGLTAQDVGTLYIAGGFGTGLNVHHALASGLLPGFQVDQVKVVGNTSLAGAYLALINRGVLEALIHAADTIEAIELNQDPAFEGRYIDHLSIG